LTQRSSKRAPKAQIGTVTKEEDAYVRGLLIHEDSELLVFNKPSGLAVQGGSGVKVDLDRLLWAFANRKGRRPKLVHRLDRDTSGVIVVAKTTPAAAHLSAQFADRTTQKTYLALVSGVPETTEGVVDVPLLRMVSAGIDLVRAAADGEDNAMSARTDWRVLASGPKAALLEVNPHSGRMHQIRAHLAFTGHPILGDTKYGGLMSMGTAIVPRLMLHAQSLALVHPATGQGVLFDVEMPGDMASLTEKLGL
jgi:23S rRNA pseudouridine955/2504/2580 synthase